MIIVRICLGFPGFPGKGLEDLGGAWKEKGERETYNLGRSGKNGVMQSLLDVLESNPYPMIPLPLVVAHCVSNHDILRFTHQLVHHKLGILANLLDGLERDAHVSHSDPVAEAGTDQALKRTFLENAFARLGGNDGTLFPRRQYPPIIGLFLVRHGLSLGRTSFLLNYASGRLVFDPSFFALLA